MKPLNRELKNVQTSTRPFQGRCQSRRRRCDGIGPHTILRRFAADAVMKIVIKQYPQGFLLRQDARHRRVVDIGKQFR